MRQTMLAFTMLKKLAHMFGKSIAHKTKNNQVSHNRPERAKKRHAPNRTRLSDLAKSRDRGCGRKNRGKKYAGDKAAQKFRPLRCG